MARPGPILEALEAELSAYRNCLDPASHRNSTAEDLPAVPPLNLGESQVPPAHSARSESRKYSGKTRIWAVAFGYTRVKRRNALAGMIAIVVSTIARATISGCTDFLRVLPEYFLLSERAEWASLQAHSVA
jgi:hypothetical protein